MVDGRMVSRSGPVVDSDALRRLSLSDPRLGKIIAKVGDYAIEIRADPFRSLVEAIIYQQLAGPAAETIYTRFLKIYRGRFPSARRIVSTRNTQLRAAGLSRQKTEYIKDLSSRVSNRRLNFKMLSTLDDAHVISELMKVRGIGRWTADMFLIFCLGRPDVLPTGDLGLRRAMMITYDLRALPTPAKMREIAQGWKPYSTAATWYLWKSLENFKGIG